MLEKYFTDRMEEYMLGPTYKSTLDQLEFGDIVLASNDGSRTVNISELMKRAAYLVEGHLGALMDRCDELCRTMKHENNQSRGPDSASRRLAASTRAIHFPRIASPPTTSLPTPPPVTPRRPPPSNLSPQETPTNLRRRQPGGASSGRANKRQRLGPESAILQRSPPSPGPPVEYTNLKSSPHSTPPGTSPDTSDAPTSPAEFDFAALQQAFHGNGADTTGIGNDIFFYLDPLIFDGSAINPQPPQS